MSWLEPLGLERKAESSAEVNHLFLKTLLDLLGHFFEALPNLLPSTLSNLIMPQVVTPVEVGPNETIRISEFFGGVATPSMNSPVSVAHVAWLHLSGRNVPLEMG